MHYQEAVRCTLTRTTEFQRVAKTTQDNILGGAEGLADADAYMQSVNLMLPGRLFMRESGYGHSGLAFGTAKVPKNVQTSELLSVSGARRGVEQGRLGDSEPVWQHEKYRTCETSI